MIKFKFEEQTISSDASEINSIQKECLEYFL